MAHESAIATRIRAALAEQLKLDVGKIGTAADLKDDLGLDSLTMLELLFTIEEVFDFEIPNADLSEIRTVGDVIAYVERRLETDASGPTASSGGALAS